MVCVSDRSSSSSMTWRTLCSDGRGRHRRGGHLHGGFRRRGLRQPGGATGAAAAAAARRERRARRRGDQRGSGNLRGDLRRDRGRLGGLRLSRRRASPARASARRASAAAAFAAWRPASRAPSRARLGGGRRRANYWLRGRRRDRRMHDGHVDRLEVAVRRPMSSKGSSNSGFAAPAAAVEAAPRTGSGFAATGAAAVGDGLPRQPAAAAAGGRARRARSRSGSAGGRRRGGCGAARQPQQDCSRAVSCPALRRPRRSDKPRARR